MIIGKINFFGAELKDRRAIKGVMGNEKGQYAIISNDGATWTLAFLKYPLDKNKVLCLDSYFVSGYNGSNYAGAKDTTHYTKDEIKAIQMLDKTFSIDENHKPTSAEYEIKVANFLLAEVWDEKNHIK